MASYNKFQFIGRLTKKPELEYSSSGNSYSRFSIAVDDSYKDETDFFNITAFGKTAENLVKFMDKGSLIMVEGNIKQGSYEKNGEKRYVTNFNTSRILFLESKRSDVAGKEQAPF